MNLPRTHIRRERRARRRAARAERRRRRTRMDRIGIATGALAILAGAAAAGFGEMDAAKALVAGGTGLLLPISGFVREDVYQPIDSIPPEPPDGEPQPSELTAEELVELYEERIRELQGRVTPTL